MVDNGLKDRRRKIRFRRALVDQRLNIRFGKHAAARGDRVQFAVLLRRFVQAGCVRLQQRCHLIDKRTGPACADAVHALIDAAVVKIYDLGILTAEFNRNVGLRIARFQCARHSNDFLHKRNTERFRESDCARSRNCDIEVAVAKLQNRFFQQFGQRFLRMCLMSAIFAEQDFVLLTENDELYGGRTDIDSGTV